ncbi:MAG: PH domain-containing protein [Parcubacteria group bacterium]
MEKIKNFELRDKEKILKIVRHHPIIIIPHLVVCFFILLLNFFLMYYLFLQGWWGAALFFAVIFFAAVYILRMFFLYRKNRFVITNQRVADFEQSGFFEKNVTEYHYSKIKSAEALVKGIWPTLFHYGNLKLAIEKSIAPFELYKVANPVKLQNIINDLLFQVKSVAPGRADSVALVMAEIDLLDKNQKEEVLRRIEQSLIDEEESAAKN